MEKTVIAYNEAIQTRESATFTVMADNFVAKWITFKVINLISTLFFFFLNNSNKNLDISCDIDKDLINDY